MDWINYAQDLAKLTHQYIDERLEMTMKDPTYAMFNMMFSDTVEVSGRTIRTDVNLRDEGNAKHVSDPYQEDTFNIENITESAESEMCLVTSNVTFNEIELAMNRGPEQIHDYMTSKVENSVRELADEIQPKLILSPCSATDKVNPLGISAWFPLGTDGSTGDWNAYSGIYNDGAGTTFNAGGISSASGVGNNERWASWYADHDGNLGDNLLDLIDFASLKLAFVSPVHPSTVGTATKWAGYKFFTNAAVIRNIRNLLRKADDSLASLENYQGVPILNGIPMVYVPEADTARTTLYGTNPFWGVNMAYTKVYTLRGFKFKKQRQPRFQNHNTFSIFYDLVYQIHCRNRRQGGFLISQQ